MGDVTRLGVLGGTFDPPHSAHLQLAEAARSALALDRVLFVPAGDPWRKRGVPVTAAAHRFAMTTAAVEGQAGLSVSDMEVRRAGPTYTADTLRALQARARTLIWFILGSDALEDLPQWHAPQQIIALARLAVAVRPGSTVLPEQLDRLLPGLAAAVDWLPLDPLAVSASAIRGDIAAGRPAAACVPPAVWTYIEEHGLYGVGR